MAYNRRKIDRSSNHHKAHPHRPTFSHPPGVVDRCLFTDICFNCSISAFVERCSPHYLYLLSPYQPSAKQKPALRARWAEVCIEFVPHFTRCDAGFECAGGDGFSCRAPCLPQLHMVVWSFFFHFTPLLGRRFLPSHHLHTAENRVGLREYVFSFSRNSV